PVFTDCDLEPPQFPPSGWLPAPFKSFLSGFPHQPRTSPRMCFWALVEVLKQNTKSDSWPQGEDV
ncbi:hypothetical protein LEMLEM_LOCUS1193, partial [Lemmus lemmus]